MVLWRYGTEPFFVSCVLVTVWAASWQNQQKLHVFQAKTRSVRVAERLALPTSDDGVAGSNPAGGEILPEPKRRFIAQSLSCSPFHRLEMTEIQLKGRKTLTHPSSIHPAKTQISLGIRPVWSESSLPARRKLWSSATHWAHSEDSD